ncbi:restriction endonuclease subunit S, partial [Tabrizicola sp.]|uniref:restriction endonuclease subunit S n=1 Tax=Tabrizicola sp. TaxID=2005166 RepID=UPI00273337F1
MTDRALFEPEVSSQHWRGAPPSHWSLKRLKWSISGLYNGIWGDEPDGENDIICIRVADFDRVRRSVISEPPTIRSVNSDYREQRVLRKGDLLIEKSGGGDNQLVGCVVHFDHDFEAVCSNFVARIPLQEAMVPQYWNYVHSSIYSARLNFPAIKQTTGIQNLDAEAYFKIEAAFPPAQEQSVIANYLDRETARIDALIAEKERMLALLEEKRAALISHAVTRGLDTNAPLKPSGQEWLGEIPAHWRVKRAKNLFTVRDERSDDGSEELLTVSHITGVTSRSEKDVNMFLADDKAGYKRCMPGDLAINTLWAWMGAMGISPLAGIVSPDYHVYTSKGELLSDYVDLLCRSRPFVAEVSRWSKGVWSSRLRLYPENFFEMRLPVPPQGEQLDIIRA